MISLASHKQMSKGHTQGHFDDSNGRGGQGILETGRKGGGGDDGRKFSKTGRG